MATNKEIDEWLDWRNQQRRRPRVMTACEYEMWCRYGDAISHSSDSNALSGGITIKFGTGPLIIGGFDD